MSDARTPRPGYWAVLPAGVRYDDRIPASAKVLYAELSALAEADGYCWAGNDYLAQVFRMTEKSIREQLHALEDAGYIRIEAQRGNHNVMIDRRIYVGLNPLQAQTEPLNEKVQPLNEKVQRHINKNNNISPPIIPRQASKADDAAAVQAAIQAAAAGDERLLKAWLDFADMRKSKRAAIKTLRTVELLSAKLETLSGGDGARKVQILEQSVASSWTGLFALKEDTGLKIAPESSDRASDGDSYWADDPYD